MQYISGLFFRMDWLHVSHSLALNSAQVAQSVRNTHNDMVRLLVENYTNTRLSNRQREGYNQMYQHLFENSKK